MPIAISQNYIKCSEWLYLSVSKYYSKNKLIHIFNLSNLQWPNIWVHLKLKLGRFKRWFPRKQYCTYFNVIASTIGRFSHLLTMSCRFPAGTLPSRRRQVTVGIWLLVNTQSSVECAVQDFMPSKAGATRTIAVSDSYPYHCAL